MTGLLDGFASFFAVSVCFVVVVVVLSKQRSKSLRIQNQNYRSYFHWMQQVVNLLHNLDNLYMVLYFHINKMSMVIEVSSLDQFVRLMVLLLQ